MHALRRSMLSASLLLALSASPVFAADEADHASLEHSFIRITNSRLHPETARVNSHEALAWVNYASRSARVSFPKDVAKHLKCNSRSSFGVTDERLVSSEIQGSGFASLCQLDAGEYSYRVELYTGSANQAGQVDRVLEGKLLVE